MMQTKHVEVAARHTLCILLWRPSRDRLTKAELFKALDAIYDNKDATHQLSITNGSYDTWKAITYDGVFLAYNHFYGHEPAIWKIKKYLKEIGDSEDWGTIGLELNGSLTEV